MPGERAGNVLADESGQDLAEYAFLIALVALAVVTSVETLGGDLLGLYDHIVASLPF
ncbi:MAG: Flp family type IVb pilin [Gemmatimonadota bacterium]